MRKISDKAKLAIEDLATRPEYRGANAKQIHDAVTRDVGGDEVSLRTVQYYLKRIRSERGGTEWFEDRFSLGSLVAHGIEFGPDDVNTLLSLGAVAEPRTGLVFTNREAIWAMRLRRFPGLANTSDPFFPRIPNYTGIRQVRRPDVRLAYRPHRDRPEYGPDPEDPEAPLHGLELRGFRREWNWPYIDRLIEMAREYAMHERLAAVSGESPDTAELDQLWMEKFADTLLSELQGEARLSRQSPFR